MMKSNTKLLTLIEIKTDLFRKLKVLKFIRSTFTILSR
ncbi:Uncharacterised protein [Sporosarcina pasteurii]|uniref:Uncharacterized protein n=1 Tax=Sporosarcina pasteurii TaxID=1474 RepID=A0A380BKP0_SPOPA|nr:Uncharacterised protein [Sporosarcina pasteurii]